MNASKQLILQLFNERVRNQPIIITGPQHFGAIGHWLEDRMNISHNALNAPDIHGYEMKKHSQKISFGDFSASEYAFTKRERKQYTSIEFDMTRKDFLQYFGHPNPLKEGRYSWSGRCVPRYGHWNDFGQMLTIESNQDICARYSFEHDVREVKHTFPSYLKTDGNVVIAIWKREKMEKHINAKFNVNGFFICNMTNNMFSSVSFGGCFNYENFLEGVQHHQIIFDSGMYMGNIRNYSHFRSVNDTFWASLLTDHY